MQASFPPTARTAAWTLAIVLLIAARLPSLLHPAGGDQSLYLYSGQRILAGDVPYRDVWDQKPPGIAFVYAALWRVWPHESIVPAADAAAAAVTAWLLLLLGRRWFGVPVGAMAAAAFLLFGDPSIQRTAGLAVRAQCETFIALAVSAALVAVSMPRRRSWHLVAGGVALACAFWLKYNAAVYALPVALAAMHPGAGGVDWRRRLRHLIPVLAGGLAVSLAVLTYFGAHGALEDLWRATIDYNLLYSRETFTASTGPIGYLLSLPLTRARVDLLWFLGLLGAGVLAVRRPACTGTVLMAWIAAALLAIAANGARGLPQYFVQAAPALALAAAAGLTSAWRSRGVWRIAAAAAVAAGLWRVGFEPVSLAQPRLGGLPSVWSNLRFDLELATGRLDPRTYLERFGGTGEVGKFSVTAVEDLADDLRYETSPSDPVLVFGFAGGGVLARSGRVSPTRFFWSRPVVVEFARDAPGYGPDGLLADLLRRPPAVVALQKRDWRIGEPAVPNSIEYFMATPRLREWLEVGYELKEDGPVFAVWRKRS